MLGGVCLNIHTIYAKNRNIQKPLPSSFNMSDQHSFYMSGSYGNDNIITHLDKLVKNGEQFNYCISNIPVCTPYRAMLMTGQHNTQ